MGQRSVLSSRPARGAHQDCSLRPSEVGEGEAGPGWERSDLETRVTWGEPGQLYQFEDAEEED